MDKQLIQNLSNLELLRGLDSEPLIYMAEQGRVLDFFNGDVLFEEGETTAHTLYFVLSGTVAVVKAMRNSERDLAILKPGDYFGEFALFSNEPRQAKIEFREQSRLFELSDEVLDKMKEQYPLALIKFYENMFAQVAKRFKQMSVKAEKSTFWIR